MRARSRLYLLLGMRWQGQLFCDATLPFGLRSAPLIFTVVADALEWVLRSKGASNGFHYVDDFVFIGPPGTDKCRADIQLFKNTCSDLGMLIAEDKTEGPATCLTVLGIEIAMELRLPADKLARLSDALHGWQGRCAGSHRDLESLVGLFATRHPGGSPWSGVSAPPLQSPRPDGVVQAALFGPLEQRGSGGHGMVVHLPPHVERYVHAEAAPRGQPRRGDLVGRVRQLGMRYPGIISTRSVCRCRTRPPRRSPCRRILCGDSAHRLRPGGHKTGPPG